PHHHLSPPFPTRRSSDLYDLPTAGSQFLRSAVAGDFNSDGKTDLAIATTACTNSPNDPGEIVIFPGQGDATLGAPALLSTAPGRSEEHTSELQSRFDLVC